MVKRRPGTTPTLEEAAALAGVGRGTVSRVINTATGVKEPTLRAVQLAITASHHSEGHEHRFPVSIQLSE